MKITKTLFIAGFAIANAYVVTATDKGVAGQLSLDNKVLPKDDDRVWQTVFDEAAPLEWRWRLDATKADVIVTNLLTRDVNTTTVMRTEGADTGSIAMPNPTRSADTGEGLIDVALVQYGATSHILKTEVARLAFLPVTIRVESGKAKFAQNGSPRVVSYDPKWSDVSTGKTTLAKTVNGMLTEIGLPSCGGYFGLEAMEGTVAVKYDDTVALSADVCKRLGIILIFK